MDVDGEVNPQIILTEHDVENASASSGTYGCTKPWSFKRFSRNFRIIIEKYNETEMEFDMIGIESALANAFRRLILSEVPSMAAEKVYVYSNTTLLKDEVLSHRLGLVPLKADMRMFEYRQQDDEEGTEQDTLEFEIKVSCSWNTSNMKDSSLPGDIYINHHVYTKHMKWLPIGNQAELYSAADVGPLYDDILLVKMRPGQEVDLKLHAVKGIGKDHAKFNPVATAYYRLLPTIKLKREIEGELAEKMQSCFSPGVIGIENKKNGKKVAKVLNARYDSCSRNYNRYDELKDAIEMDVVRDHFIFTIESVGALPPDVLFIEAVKVLQNRCRMFLDELNHQ